MRRIREARVQQTSTHSRSVIIPKLWFKKHFGDRKKVLVDLFENDEGDLVIRESAWNVNEDDS